MAKEVTSPRALIITTKSWPLGVRVALGLKAAGFDVAALSPTGDLVRTTRAIARHYRYLAVAPLISLRNAIVSWAPSIVVGSDDQAILDLHRLHGRERLSINSVSQRIQKLIEFSLGEPSSFAVAAAKSNFMQVAWASGIRCPETTIIPDEAALVRQLASSTFPIVLKADGSWGGNGVRIASNEQQARRSFHDLMWSNAFTRVAARETPLARYFPPHYRRVVTTQPYIAGRPANRAVFCLHGQILNGISVEALATLYETGPATVVRVIDHPEMTRAAAVLVDHLKLSGFVGFDFIIDDEGRAWLLEMNPRVTPICHLKLRDGTSLPAQLFQHLTGAVTAAKPANPSDEIITLFPQEWLRSPFSPHLTSGRHDVPWEEPEFIAACFKMASKGGLLRQFWKKLRQRGAAPLDTRKLMGDPAQQAHNQLELISNVEE